MINNTTLAGKGDVLSYLSDDPTMPDKPTVTLLFLNDQLELIGRIDTVENWKDRSVLKADAARLFTEASGVLLVARGEPSKAESMARVWWPEINRICRETPVSPLDSLVLAGDRIRSLTFP